MKYRREIDGLRAVAVVPVVLFHAGAPGFDGGFVGVDIFFVISGYLITSIIFTEVREGTFSFLKFYERRARRILPALFAVLAICLPIAWFWLMPGDLKLFGQGLVAVCLFSSNLLFWHTSNYFDKSAELNPLLHTWSLAIEEQFYLFFPILLMSLKRLSRNKLLALLTGLFVVSAVYGNWMVGESPVAAFYLLPTRAWELLAGSIVALHLANENPARTRKWIEQGVSALGLLLILYAIFLFNRNTPFPSYLALVPTIGAAFVIVFANPGTCVHAILANKHLVGIGLISYSAYLWHQPLFAFARQVSLSNEISLTIYALAAATFGFAYLSWRFVEGPFRIREKVSLAVVTWFCIGSSAALISVGLALHVSKGVEGRLSTDQNKVLSFEKYDFKSSYLLNTCFIDKDKKGEDFSPACGSANNRRGVLVWGDSHAAALASGLRSHESKLSQFASAACPPFLNVRVSGNANCAQVNSYVLNRARDIEVGVVLLHANWSAYKEVGLEAELEKTLRLLHEALPGTRLVVVGPGPQWQPSLPVFMARKHVPLDRVWYLPSPELATLSQIDKLLAEKARIHKATYFSILDAVCNREGCLATTRTGDAVTVAVWDYGHLTEAGATAVSAKLWPALRIGY